MLNEQELKIQALLERVSTLTTDYENKIADLRVSLTVTTQAVNELRERLENESVSQEAPTEVASD